MSGGENGDRRLPGWAGFLIGLTAPLAAVAVGYGELRGEVEALEKRVERAEKDAEKYSASQSKVLEDLRNAVGTVQLDVAWIRATLKDERRPPR